MRLRIVIFDKDESVFNLIKTLVTMHGSHEVLIYSEPALCPLYTEPHCTCPREEACADILITDNNLSNMTGLELIWQQHLRRCKGTTRNKAVISEAWSRDDYELAQSLGCKIFTKPIAVDEFLKWLDACEATFLPQRKLTELS